MSRFPTTISKETEKRSEALVFPSWEGPKKFPISPPLLLPSWKKDTSYFPPRSSTGCKTWIEDPKQLFRTWDCFPNAGMTEEERWNAMTRLILVLTILLLLVGVGNWWLFLIFGAILVALLWYTTIPTVRGSARNPSSVDFLRCRRTVLPSPSSGVGKKIPPLFEKKKKRKLCLVPKNTA